MPFFAKKNTWRNFTFMLSFSFLFLASSLFAQVLAPQKTLSSDQINLLTKNPVLVTVEGGKTISIEDIQNRDIHELRKKLYTALQQKVVQAAIAELSKVNPEYSILPKKNVNPTEKDLKDFYKQRQMERYGDYNTLAPQIRQYLVTESMRVHLQQQYDKAIAKGDIHNYLSEPADFLVETAIETAFLRGNEKAKVMFLEYSDYQCPFCTRVQGTVNNLMKKYGEKVAFGYRHNPLPFHKEADEAAVAAECAREQDKFEEFHNILFERKDNQKIEDLKRYARELKIEDLAKFDACLDSDKYRGLVEHDKQVAQSLGLTGTPSFVIGTFDPSTGKIQGEVLSGALPESNFLPILEKYISKAK